MASKSRKARTGGSKAKQLKKTYPVPREMGASSVCEPLSQVLVRAFAPGTEPETVSCTSDADFLVHYVSNGSNNSFSITVKSTGFSTGVNPSVTSFTIGAGANDVITFIFQPGATGFITLQTKCTANASVTG